jgi:hypothetical protein
MSYTLRGRLESRLAAGLVPVLVAVALALGLREWWPVELAALMVGVGLALDLVYDRVLDYQPGWLAAPLGLLELGLVMTLAFWLDVRAQLLPAVAFFVCSWVLAQVLAHAGFPLLALSYAEDGGELGRGGSTGAIAAGAVLLAAGGVAWSQVPPTVRLSAGVHEGPIVLDHAQKLVGEPGAIVRGGIVIRANDVTVRKVTVVGGENGIDVENATGVSLDRVTVVGARVDGIHVRRGRVKIEDCRISSPDGYTQGIDISFSADKGMSMVEGCTVVGGQEGIVIDSAAADVRRNHVTATSLRAISVNEMSMGMVEHNEVARAVGVGIFCSDYSMCEIEENVVADTKPDVASGAGARMGYGIVLHYGAEAELRNNRLVRNPRGVGAFARARIVSDLD